MADNASRLAVAGAMLAASSTYGFMTNYDNGRVDFVGRVTDISCSVALNGANNAGSGNVWLAPVSWRKSIAAGPAHL